MLRTKALLIALVAASADAANLRASDSRRLAGHGGHDDGDCQRPAARGGPLQGDE